MDDEFISIQGRATDMIRAFNGAIEAIPKTRWCRVTEVGEYSIVVKGLEVPFGYKVSRLKFQPDSNPPIYNNIKECISAGGISVLYLENPIKDYPLYRRVLVECQSERDSPTWWANYRQLWR